MLAIVWKISRKANFKSIVNCFHQNQISSNLCKQNQRVVFCHLMLLRNSRKQIVTAIEDRSTLVYLMLILATRFSTEKCNQMVWPQYVVLVRLPKNYMVFKHCQAEVSQIKSPVSFSYSAQKWQKPSIFSTVANAVTFSCGWFGSLKKRRKEAKLNLTLLKEATNSKDVWTKPSKCSGHLLTICAMARRQNIAEVWWNLFVPFKCPL